MSDRHDQWIDDAGRYDAECHPGPYVRIYGTDYHEDELPDPVDLAGRP